MLNVKKKNREQRKNYTKHKQIITIKGPVNVMSRTPPAKMAMPDL